jgi:hypothetical protein
MPDAITLAEASKHVDILKKFSGDRWGARLLWAHKDCFGLPFSRGVLWLAREIASEAFRTAPVYFAVLESGVFPDSELPEMYSRIRRSAGVESDVRDRPVDVCQPGDEGYFVDLFFVAVANLWDVAIVNRDGSVCLFLSDDELICVVNGSTALIHGMHRQIRAQGGMRLRARHKRDLTGGPPPGPF